MFVSDAHPIVIAVDGTSGSGKSTNSKIIARTLGFKYVDTGAMYRTLAWFCLKNQVDLNEETAIAGAVDSWDARLTEADGSLRLEVGGYYPEKEIRTEEISGCVSAVAANPAVRAWMKMTQRSCIDFGSLVMEGRDIGSNIFPDSPFKFYVDANLAERETRRAAEGVNEDLAARDKMDSERKTNPLIIPDGAVCISTSGMTPDQSSSLMMEHIRRIAQENKIPLPA